MIIDFSITNFGSIKDTITLSFEAETNNKLDDYYILKPVADMRLLKLAVIYGPNASGKTTILKAFDFLRSLVLSPLDKKNSELDYEPFKFDTASRSSHSTLELNFICQKRRFSYRLDFTKKCILNETLAEIITDVRHVVFTRATDVADQLSHICIRSEYLDDSTTETKLEAATLWNNTVLGGSLKANISFRLINDIVSWFEDYLSAIIVPRHNLFTFISRQLDNGIISKKDIIQMMHRADLMISDIIIQEEELSDEESQLLLDAILSKNNQLNISPEDVGRRLTRKHIEFAHKTITGQELLSYEEESLGTQRFYQFSGLVDLLIRKSLFFPIDEAESSLHPDLFEFFLYSFLCNSHRSQLLITTHYREFLMNSDMVRPDAVWFTDRNADGSTDLYSLADFDESIFTNNRSFYDAYKIGRLGAKPNISDYYLDLSDNEE